MWDLQFLAVLVKVRHAMKCLWRDNPLRENFRITFSAQERVCKEYTLDGYHNHWQNCLKLTWKHSLYLNWIYLINLKKKPLIIVKKNYFLVGPNFHVPFGSTISNTIYLSCPSFFSQQFLQYKIFNVRIAGINIHFSKPSTISNYKSVFFRFFR